jgi:hypothetical protein
MEWEMRIVFLGPNVERAYGTGEKYSNHFGYFKIHGSYCIGSKRTIKVTVAY